MYLVDDAQETLETLRLQYEIHPEIAVVGMADDSEIAWEPMAARRPDIVSIDIELGADSGFDLCRKVAEKMPDVFIVMCSVDADEQRKREAERAGAHWFLAKPVSHADIRRLLEVIRDRRSEGGQDKSATPSERSRVRKADLPDDAEEDWPNAILGDLG